MTSQPAAEPAVEQAAAPPPLLNVANALTAVRILLVPLMIVLFMHDGARQPEWRLAAVVVFLLASLTDRLDGQLARRRNLVTDFGKVADPIADKALIGAALICLSLVGQLHWWVTGIIMGREIAVTLIRMAVIRYAVMAASKGGKAKTVTQICAITGYLLPAEWVNHFSWVGVVVVALMVVAVAITIATGVDYAVQAAQIIRHAKAPRGVDAASPKVSTPVALVDSAQHDADRSAPAAAVASQATAVGDAPVAAADAGAEAQAGARAGTGAGQSVPAAAGVVDEAVKPERPVDGWPDPQAVRPPASPPAPKSVRPARTPDWAQLRTVMRAAEVGDEPVSPVAPRAVVPPVVPRSAVPPVAPRSPAVPPASGSAAPVVPRPAVPPVVPRPAAGPTASGTGASAAPRPAVPPASGSAASVAPRPAVPPVVPRPAVPRPAVPPASGPAAPVVPRPAVPPVVPRPAAGPTASGTGASGAPRAGAPGPAVPARPFSSLGRDTDPVAAAEARLAELKRRLGWDVPKTGADEGED
ncbi:MAG: CDP-diacylglycerol--glycerol-3-phosphate 3-phosphatidyltransferase [Bifidobacteriaceae bacterium]|nr:CDP-diacylglycerol--glycerol-3-phosphate 3-phosphatidyltransferase [Bifidobacteriaceae bacterium]